jgi:hypothetical protein
MTPEQVLDDPALVLDQRARKRYFDDGFLTVPGYVAPAWLDRLRAVVAAKIEASRALTASDDQFDLAPDHPAEKPNIRRLRKAVAQHPSSRMRPLLLNVYAAADVLPMAPAPTPTSRTRLLVRGREPVHVHMEPYPARLPPRWDQVGHRSIFSAQAPASRPASADQAPSRPAP